LDPNLQEGMEELEELEENEEFMESSLKHAINGCVSCSLATVALLCKAVLLEDVILNLWQVVQAKTNQLGMLGGKLRGSGQLRLVHS
jgi:hypothetical protein